MVRRWDRFRNPWDREYAMRGTLWRGTADAAFLPAYVPVGTRIVELGSGDGKFLKGLRTAGYATLGVDFARHAVTIAREHGLGPLLLADVRALPLRDASCPAVAARYVLGSLLEKDRRRASSELARTLAPGGILLVEEFSTEDFRASAGAEVEERTRERNRGLWTHYFERAEVPSLLPAFEVLSIEAVTSRQKTAEGAKARHRWRWILRRDR